MQTLFLSIFTFAFWSEVIFCSFASSVTSVPEIESSNGCGWCFSVLLCYFSWLHFYIKPVHATGLGSLFSQLFYVILRCSRYLAWVWWLLWLIGQQPLALLCICGTTQVSGSIRILPHMAHWLGDTSSWERRFDKKKEMCYRIWIEHMHMHTWST